MKIKVKKIIGLTRFFFHEMMFWIILLAITAYVIIMIKLDPTTEQKNLIRIFMFSSVFILFVINSLSVLLKKDGKSFWEKVREISYIALPHGINRKDK